MPAVSLTEYAGPLLAAQNLTMIEVFILVSLGVMRGRAKLVASLVSALVAVNLALFVLSPGAQRAAWLGPTGVALVQSDALIPRALVPGTVVIKGVRVTGRGELTARAVKYAALNPVDLKPFAVPPMLPFLRWVLPHTLGRDVSGVVAESSCAGLRPGDEVYGFALFGSVTEYALTLCQGVGRKPAALPFDKAAALPVAVSAAYVGLQGAVRKGDTVLVIGVSGGCGQMGALLAKSMGAATLVCVASSRNEAVARALGCDVVFDYAAAGFASSLESAWGGKVDVVFDAVSEDKVDYYDVSLRLLKRDGTIKALNGNARDWLGMLSGTWARPRRTLVWGRMQPAMWDALAAKQCAASHVRAGD